MSSPDLDAVLQSIVERLRAGDRPTLEEYADEHPELAAEIEGLLPILGLLEGAAEEDVAYEHPERLGEYRILREVARGGMGIVYEAVQEPLGRRVALKLLPRHALLDSKRKERFRREARAAACLHHTNIVPVFGVSEQDGVPFYSMQFLRGRPLDEVIAELRRIRDESGTRPALPGSRDRTYYGSVVRIGTQVCEALAYAHSEGVLHRDVKPANLILDAKGNVWADGLRTGDREI